MQRVRQLWERLRSRGAPETVVALQPARLVIGLGNPGPRYVATRHNVGFRVVERLAERHGSPWRLDRDLQARVASLEIGDEVVLLLQPQTFMNRSGTSLAAALDRWPELGVDRLLVVYDDLDLPTGRIRLRPSGGAGGHRGMSDILERLSTRSVPRLRFGIGHPGSASGVLDWVLAPFSEEQAQALPEALDRAAAAVEMVILEGLAPAMGRFNAAASPVETSAEGPGPSD